MKQSAGLLLFRKKEEPEFFLVHPGGPFFTRKDAGWWTVPKGALLKDESPLDAAVREFEEETGFKVEGEFKALTPVVQKGGKQVLCWAIEQDLNPEKIKSNTFEIEWPPRSGKTKRFPEIDRAAWFNYKEAVEMINEKQIPFLDEVMAEWG